MIVHIMLNTVFTRPYIEFVLAHFDRRQHRFLIVGGADPDEIPTPEDPEVLDRVRAFRSRSTSAMMYRFLLRQTRDADRIVLHGLFDPRTTMFLYLNPGRARRSCWVIWGADLHIYRELRDSAALSLADRLVRGRVFRTLAFVVPLAPGDVDVLEGAYGIAKDWTIGVYINVVTVEQLDAQPLRTRAPGQPVRVLVGNSASASNNHAEVLELLARFKDEPVEILVPLSYGDASYAASVRSRGAELLGDRFIALDKFLAPPEYAALLATIDVAIFNHTRQQALGNYFALAYLGTKIYTRTDGPSARYLAGDMGIPMYEVATLATVPFEQLPVMDPVDREEARRAARAFYDPRHLVSVWERVFSAHI